MTDTELEERRSLLKDKKGVSIGILRNRHFWRDRWIMLFFFIAFMINMAAIAYVIYKFPDLPEFLPLHYDSTGEVDYVGLRGEAFKIPLIGTTIWVANFFLAMLICKMEIAASRILLGGAAVAQIFVLISTFTIIY